MTNERNQGLDISEIRSLVEEKIRDSERKQEVPPGHGCLVSIVIFAIVMSLTWNDVSIKNRIRALEEQVKILQESKP